MRRAVSKDVAHEHDQPQQACHRRGKVLDLGVPRACQCVVRRPVRGKARQGDVCQRRQGDGMRQGDRMRPESERECIDTLHILYGKTNPCRRRQSASVRMIAKVTRASAALGASSASALSNRCFLHPHALPPTQTRVRPPPPATQSPTEQKHPQSTRRQPRQTPSRRCCGRASKPPHSRRESR